MLKVSKRLPIVLNYDLAIFGSRLRDENQGYRIRTK